MEAALAYLHYLSILVLTGCLASEYLICNPDLQPPTVRLLGRIDTVYLLAALAVLGTGLLRAFAVGKGSAFYLSNPVFHLKLALFVAVALISIPPTLQFLRWNRALNAGDGRVLTGAQIASVRRYLLLELVLLAFIPLCAALMARGIGLRA
jgi:putative membrane protein